MSMRSTRAGRCRCARAWMRTWRGPRRGRCPWPDVPSMGTFWASRRMARLLGIWPPVETMTPWGALKVDDVHHALEGQLVEVEAVTHVVVGRHGLRVVVYHDRTPALLADGGPRPARRTESNSTELPMRYAPEPRTTTERLSRSKVMSLFTPA